MREERVRVAWQKIGRVTRVASVQTTRRVASEKRVTPAPTTRRPDFADYILLGTAALVATAAVTGLAYLIF